MSIWIVSYDLRAPGRDYERLYKALKSVAYARPLESFWIIEAEGTAASIRDWLATHVDKNDRLVVIEFTPQADWALRQISKEVGDWFKAKRP
jgi:hypothetical protein